MKLQHRGWVNETSEQLVQRIASETKTTASAELIDKINGLAEENKNIHEKQCFNLNPATNVMNPKAEKLLSSGIGSRPSLGYPGDKYEMGLEAIEEIEVVCAQICSEVFDAKFVEMPSGAIANLYGFMAICKPGDTIIVPPASVGGHVTHHELGCAGLYGLTIIEAPVNKDGYTTDIEALRSLALALVVA